MSSFIQIVWSSSSLQVGRLAISFLGKAQIPRSWIPGAQSPVQILEMTRFPVFLWSAFPKMCLELGRWGMLQVALCLCTMKSVWALLSSYSWDDQWCESRDENTELTDLLVAELRTVVPIRCASLKTRPDQRSCREVVDVQSGQSQPSDLPISM